MTRRQQLALVLLLAATGCYYLGTVLTSRNRNRFSRRRAASTRCRRKRLPDA